MSKCGKRVGEKPWWMGDYQYEPCYCLLDRGHEDECQCEHTVKPGIIQPPTGQIMGVDNDYSPGGPKDQPL